MTDRDQDRSRESDAQMGATVGFAEMVREAERQMREAQRQGKPIVIGLPSQNMLALLGHWDKLEKVYAAFDQAADRVTKAIGVPICVENCGLCCVHATPFATGVEAEYAISYLLGNPAKINPLLDRVRDWLTSKRLPYTYGSRFTREQFETTLQHEMTQAASEQCPFLGDDKRCEIHPARPPVCRAYGVTHIPDYWCPRPNGLGESQDARASWDAGNPEIPVRALYQDLNAGVTDPQHRREGFLPTLIYEKFRPGDLAGLLDDGKAPMAKLIVGGGGSGRALLWQEQLDEEWSNREADAAIEQAVPLEDRDGVPVVVIRQKGA